MTPKQLSNLLLAAPEAIKCQEYTGIPAQLTIAQWAMESAWGEKAPGNNCFGIKHYPNAPGRQFLVTKEWILPAKLSEWLRAVPGRAAQLSSMVSEDSSGRRKYTCVDAFAKYPSLADCFMYRAKLLTNSRYYRAYVEAYKVDGDLEKLVRGISQFYATDPNYSNVILHICRMKEVVAALDSK